MMIDLHIKLSVASAEHLYDFFKETETTQLTEPKDSKTSRLTTNLQSYRPFFR
jgi:hypothetical protein